MKLKQLLMERLSLPRDKQRFLPASYQRIGDIIMVSLPQELDAFSQDIGRAILEGYRVRTVCARGPVTGEKREPDIRVLAGEENTETVHKEGGVLYALDVARVMFSKGNVRERHRLTGLVKPGETVVDMFAGIGYFSIPIAKACPTCRIFAIDVNPVSVHYLLENARLNGVDKRVNVIEGDCREVRMRNKADRVIMGYLPGTEKFLPAAFRFLKGRGTVHYHNVYRKAELWDRPLGELRLAASQCGYDLKKVSYRGRVKRFAPGKWHAVMDGVFSQKEGLASLLKTK